jgi:hypothetical protein
VDGVRHERGEGDVWVVLLDAVLCRLSRLLRPLRDPIAIAVPTRSTAGMVRA